ncbi:MULTISPECIES: hypothetical protein [Acinetobacter]|uniref:hypothetical protein n=1 Tax=Acinetobacter TaxID=469 RepID=UPI00028CC28F|nr:MULTISPECIES: hypothetical protein [Acinetobacter]EKU3442134.1 hypothetical protein [Acinetobacter baumannii]MDP7849518.1 hypothetical protein [Acinetobacter baumannii]BBL22322.1 hypothetical protein ACRAD_29930 [Acinetobacter radioresistens DSM 6976 = NBRC 102413 = CIP 103788]
MFMDRSHIELIIISSIAILFIIVIIKPLRDLTIWFIKDMIIPAILWFFNYVVLFFIKQLKEVVISHQDIFKNLYSSRAVIFWNLDDQRKDRDKAMNRKT